MKLRYVLISVLLIAVLIVAAIFIFPKLVSDDNPTTNDNTSSTTQNSTPETVTNAPAATATTAVTVPQEMQDIIDTNTEALFVDDSSLLATDYPDQMIPLYSVLDVSESYQITSDTGQPGWTASYVSELSTTEILSFYRPLLSDQSNFSEETTSQSTNLKATVSGYSISITVSPNNTQKTDLPGNSAVTIFIEQV